LEPHQARAGLKAKSQGIREPAAYSARATVFVRNVLSLRGSVPFPEGFSPSGNARWPTPETRRLHSGKSRAPVRRRLSIRLQRTIPPESQTRATTLHVAPTLESTATDATEYSAELPMPGWFPSHESSR